MNDIFLNLKMMRRRKNLTLQELGELVNLSASSLSKLERGNTDLTMSMLGKLCKALECSPGELVGMSPPELNQWEADLIEIFQHLGTDIRTMKMIDAAETGMYRLANEGNPEISDRLDELRQHYLDELKESLDDKARIKILTPVQKSN